MKLVLLLGIAASAGISALAELPPVPWPKPYLIVEAWKDRPWVSDLYVYDLSGREIKRLTACTTSHVQADRNVCGWC